MIAGAESKVSPVGAKRRTPGRMPVLWSSHQPSGTAKEGRKNGQSCPPHIVMTFSTTAEAGAAAKQAARAARPPAARQRTKAKVMKAAGRTWVGTLPVSYFADIA